MENVRLARPEPPAAPAAPAGYCLANALSDWPGSVVFVSHDTEFVEQLAPTKVLLMPDGDVDYFDADWLELVALA